MIKNKTLFFLCIFLCFYSCVVSLSACGVSDNNENDIEDNFETLLVYCENNGTKASSYSYVSWSGTDNINTDTVYFTLRVYDDKTIYFIGESTFPYNRYIQGETSYSIKFVYGSQKSNEIDFEINYTALLRVLQSEYNYSPYISDKIVIIDNDAVFNINSWESSCSYDSMTTKSNVLSCPNPNGTLNEVAEEYFKIVKNYLSSKVKISLF